MTRGTEYEVGDVIAEGLSKDKVEFVGQRREISEYLTRSNEIPAVSNL